MLLYKNQVVITKTIEVIQSFFGHSIRNRQRFLVPTKCPIIFDLHDLGGWNFHKMSVTKFNSEQGVNLPPPNRNRVNTIDNMPKL